MTESDRTIRHDSSQGASNLKGMEQNLPELILAFERESADMLREVLQRAGFERDRVLAGRGL